MAFVAVTTQLSKCWYTVTGKVEHVLQICYCELCLGFQNIVETKHWKGLVYQPRLSQVPHSDGSHVLSSQTLSCAVMQRVPKDTTWRTKPMSTCDLFGGSKFSFNSSPSTHGFSSFSWRSECFSFLFNKAKCETSSETVGYSNISEGRREPGWRMLQVVNLASKEALKVIAIVEFRPKCRQCSPLEVKIRLQGAQVSKANYFRKKRIINIIKFRNLLICRNSWRGAFWRCRWCQVVVCSTCNHILNHLQNDASQLLHGPLLKVDKELAQVEAMQPRTTPLALRSKLSWYVTVCHHSMSSLGDSKTCFSVLAVHGIGVQMAGLLFKAIYRRST